MGGDLVLEGLNAKLPEPVPMNRFRPNVTVSGCEPFDEDDWGSILIGGGSGGGSGGAGGEGSGGVPCDFVKPCSRCTITTVDQSTGKFDQGQPLTTLGVIRSGAACGQGLVYHSHYTTRHVLSSSSERARVF